MSNQSPNYSHPDQPVRHSYPLAIKTEGFSTAVGLCLKTMPYILIRLGVMIAFTVAAIIWLALCGGVAYLFSGRDGSGSGGGILLFIIGIGLPAGIFYWLRQYVLYLLKCGHVAVLTKLITDGSLPEGATQVEYGKKIVTDRFKETSILMVIDSFVTGITNAFNRTLDWISSMLPIPGMQSVMQVVHAVVRGTTTFVDETILSYNLARGDENFWRSSMDGLVYYAANVKPILKTAILSVIIQYAITFGLFLICLAPAYLVSMALPGAVSGFAWLVAVALAATIKSAFLDPVFFVMVALTFHKSVQNQPFDQASADTLNTVTGKFGELKAKALAYGSTATRAAL